MIISDENALERLASSDNLMNRLRNLSNKTLTNKVNGIRVFIPGGASETNIVPVEKPEIEENKTPTLDQLINDADARISIATAHDKAVDLMNSAVDQLRIRLDEIKADKLPSVIAAASKMVTDIRREKLEADKNSERQNVHFHFYTPEQKRIEQYEIIDVG